jgi:hypothetical protein
MITCSIAKIIWKYHHYVKALQKSDILIHQPDANLQSAGPYWHEKGQLF